MIRYILPLLLLLSACVDRGTELSREPIAKHYLPARSWTTVHRVGDVPVIQTHRRSERWEILYRISWELTEPTERWIQVPKETWQAADLEVR